MSEFANNESAFEALLESIKQASNNIKRDAGTRFETLISKLVQTRTDNRQILLRMH